MSTPFYDLASLVVVPSGYKASKVYAQKPLTTDGQLAFTRSTTATRVNSAGLIEASAINVPRLDYLNSSCPRLLLEPQRSNLVTYSESFDNAAWSKFSVTVSANTSVSPDGSANADTLTTSAAGGKLYRSFTSTAGSYTLSVFVKKGTSSTAFLNFYDGSISEYVCETVFNLNNGTFTGAVGGSAFITDYGNGFWRIGIIDTLGSSAASEISIGLSTTTTGNAFIYGAQLEAGAYATSYIPTLGASVTRGADAASKTGISSLIGQTEGTIFFEINSSNFESYTQRIFSISDDTNDNIIGFQLTGSNEINYYVEVGGVLSALITKSAPAITLGQNVKVAAAYKANDFVLYVGGVQVGTDSSGAVPATSVLRYANPTGNAPYIGKVVQTLLFKTRLSNADLAALTA